MPIGYARVRPDPRDTQSQREALARHGLQECFFDIGRTGLNLPADALDAAIVAAGEGGTLAVTKLSRLARSLAELGQVLFRLAGQNITLQVGPATFDLHRADQLLIGAISVAADFDADLAAQDDPRSIESSPGASDDRATSEGCASFRRPSDSQTIVRPNVSTLP
ncbi:Resolvase, N terminal domain [Nakamurella panacisegetis]|uniref:Resolvase, N terminal domain n=2 Tax=Nakamurella panacisegetis TaxID=1090615 RepID=A0A1H0KV93_9ACTN|nr:Resolvase, N terminal domain [Nakamurella panacisegetis]